MENVICLLNIKGGVGKTMVTINIAGELSRKGFKVLIIDNDPQSNCSLKLKANSEYDMYDLYSNTRVKFEDCVSHVRDNVYIIPNNLESALLEMELQNRHTRELVLYNKYKDFEHDFDFILIDNGPHFGLCVKNSLMISDYYLEIIDNDISSIQGLEMVKRMINLMKSEGALEDLKLLGIIRNMFDKVSNFTNDFNKYVESKYGSDLFDYIISPSVKYKEAVTSNEFIYNYSPGHGMVYTDIVNQLLERVGKNG